MITKYKTKASEFEKLSKEFFEYIRLLESENKALKKQIEYYNTRVIGSNPQLVDIDFPARIYNVLKIYAVDNGFAPNTFCLNDIYQVPFEDLLKYRNFGKNSLKELNRIFYHYGLAVKDLP